MKKLLIPAAALLLSSLLLPAMPAWAGHDMANMEMGGAGDTAIMLENAHVDGVMAMTHLYPLAEGMKETHHMMVMFTGMEDKKPITEGTAAVKIVDPKGVKGEPIHLMLMGDGFGSNIALPESGMYTLEVGTKLADGKKRVFTFTYDKK